MPQHNDHPGSALLRKLDSIIRLSDEERDALASLPLQVTKITADQDIVRQGDRPSRCSALLEGYTCTYKVLGEGKRQIVTFHMPGDIPDVQSLHLPRLDCSIATLTPAIVGFIDHVPLRRLCEAYPRITAALWRDTLVDAAIFREWLANTGSRQAPERIAHFFCEFLVRSEALGLATGNSCPFPLTQQEVGDAMGLSNVHVNRTLKELRAEGLASVDKHVLTVTDRPGLEQLGDFDPGYLNVIET